MNNKILRYELSPKDVQVKKMLNKEFLELDIYAISNIYPNRNKSAFTSDSLTKSLNTCYNKPILGSFNVLLDDFNQHNGEEKVDKEYNNVYWDTNGKNDEHILGVIRESDDIKVVEEDGLNWLKISCVLWTHYAYKQVKRILKSTTKKVSVEILVKESHYDSDDILVIDEFILTGITILGDAVSEGIPNAHLSVPELMKKVDFSKQMQSLSFAYNQKDGSNQDIKLGIIPDLYNNSDELEGNNMTYAEKLAFLHSKLAEKMNAEDNCTFYICDFSDDFVIIRDYCEDKYYKINYDIVTDEDACNVSFDIENKVEQIPTFKDLAREFVSINDENKNIDELFAMYNESVEAHNALKEEYEAKTYSVVIDEVEYNVEELNAKYSSDIEALNAQHSEEIDTLNAQYSENVAAKDTEIAELSEKLSAKEEECNEIKEQYDNLQKEVEAEKANKLCDEGIALADSEDDLDEDDKECIKEKCSKHEYASISEVEDDIARALYQKKKNNRSKSFKVNTSNSHKENEPKTVFDKL